MLLPLRRLLLEEAGSLMSHVRETVKAEDLGGVRVLVVEDQWHVANALRSVLQTEGMEVSGPAGKTADAHRLADEHEPQLAVVDINLKGEMAYSLIDHLHDRGVRVVVISGYAVLPRLSAKVAAVLQKPFNAPELLASLRRALL
jgi:two-component system, response regulator PdtaR